MSDRPNNTGVFLLPTDGIKDRQIRNFLDRLVEVWDERNDGQERFVTRGELHDLARTAAAEVVTGLAPSDGGAPVPGLPGADAPLLSLSATAIAFIFTNAAATEAEGPASITLTATLKNVSGVPTFVATAYDAANASLGTITLGGAGSVRTLSKAQFVSLGATTTRYVQVVATLGSLSDTFTIYRGDGGSDAVNGLLTNEAHAVPASVDGVVASFTGAGGSFNVYRGITDVSAGCTYAVVGNPHGLTASINASGVYAVTGAGTWLDGSSVATLTLRATYQGATIDKVFTITKSIAGAAGADAQLLTVSASGAAFVFADVLATSSDSPTISFVATLANLTGTATFTATAYDAAGVSLGTITLGGAGNTRTLTAAQFNSLGATTTKYVKVVADLSGQSDTVTVYRGDGGTNAIAGYLTNEAHTVPASTSGVVSSFSGASGSFNVYQGLTDVSASCTYSIFANPSTLTASINASGLYSVTAAGSWADASDTTTITFRATFAGTNIDKVFTLTKSRTGATGATGSTGSTGAAGSRGSIMLQASGSSWSDTTANNAITSATGSSTKVIGDTVTISSGGFAETRYWSGTAWITGVKFNGNVLVSGTVVADSINVNGTTGISLISGTDVGKIKLDAGGNLVFQQTVSGKELYLLSATGGGIYVDDTGSGLTRIGFLTPGGGFAGSIDALGSVLSLGSFGRDLKLYSGTSGANAMQLHAGSFTFPGSGKLVTCTTALAAGNASGNVPVNNGTVNTSLNAEMVGGQSWAAIQGWVGGNYQPAGSYAAASHTHPLTSIDTSSATPVKFRYSTDGATWTDIYLSRVNW